MSIAGERLAKRMLSQQVAEASAPSIKWLSIEVPFSSDMLTSITLLHNAVPDMMS
jgi:hypothetical protein